MDIAYEVRTAAYEAVAHGEAEIVGEHNGEPIFELTETGHERARAIIDAAIFAHGQEAGMVLAEALGVEEQVGEQLVYMRLQEKLQ